MFKRSFLLFACLTLGSALHSSQGTQIAETIVGDLWQGKPISASRVTIFLDEFKKNNELYSPIDSYNDLVVIQVGAPELLRISSERKESDSCRENLEAFLEQLITEGSSNPKALASSIETLLQLYG